jgi:cell wall-associated NlpC family hydrolase
VKPNFHFADIARKYVGSPYKLGGWSRESGFDCVSLIVTILNDYGINPPMKFEGLNNKSYAALWTGNKQKAKSVLFRYLLGLGSEVKTCFAFTGDIIFISGNGKLTAGIHGGNDLVLSAFTDRGVALANLQAYSIERAIRWAKPQ